MNIKVEQLAKKPFEVKGSVKNLKKTYAFQKSMAEMETVTEDHEGLEVFDAMTEMLDELIEYLTSTLHLSDKQIDTLEDLEQQEVINIAQYVAMRIMGMSDKDITATLEETTGEGLAVAQENE